MIPAFIGEAVFMHAEEGAPARGERFALRVHVRFVREFVALARVAAEAGGDDVVPRGASALVAGQDVVQIELRFRQDFRAVLAGELVPEKYIPAGEFHLQPRQPVINREDDDLWHPDRDFRAVDHFRIRAVERIGNP